MPDHAARPIRAGKEFRTKSRLGNAAVVADIAEEGMSCFDARMSAMQQFFAGRKLAQSKSESGCSAWVSRLERICCNLSGFIRLGK